MGSVQEDQSKDSCRAEIGANRGGMESLQIRNGDFDRVACITDLGGPTLLEAVAFPKAVREEAELYGSGDIATVLVAITPFLHASRKHSEGYEQAPVIT